MDAVLRYFLATPGEGQQCLVVFFIFYFYFFVDATLHCWTSEAFEGNELETISRLMDNSNFLICF